MSADRQIEMDEYPSSRIEAKLADALVRIEQALTRERDALPEGGTLWHRGARTGLARALDIVREAQAS